LVAVASRHYRSVRPSAAVPQAIKLASRYCSPVNPRRPGGLGVAVAVKGDDLPVGSCPGAGTGPEAQARTGGQGDLHDWTDEVVPSVVFQATKPVVDSASSRYRLAASLRVCRFIWPAMVFGCGFHREVVEESGFRSCPVRYPSQFHQVSQSQTLTIPPVGCAAKFRCVPVSQ